MDNQWSKLQELYDKARESGLGFSMVYHESDDTWYFKVGEFVGKSRPFDIALETAIEWLEGHPDILEPGVALKLPYP